jgi:hypothetical protein
MHTPTPKGFLQPKGLTDEKATRMLNGFHEGRTLRPYFVKVRRFMAYCDTHPEYAREALPLLEANRNAANRRKGARWHSRTHCKAGLHLMTPENTQPDDGYGKRCRACRKLTEERAQVMPAKVVDAVTRAIASGKSLNEICHGKPTGGGGGAIRGLCLTKYKTLMRYRQENPEFARFVADAIAGNNSRGQQIRHARERARKQIARRREEANDYQKIRAMLPASFPDKDDVVSRIFESLLHGSLRRDDVRSRVKFYLAVDHDHRGHQGRDQ